jgi:glycosyltransferase involved in cell wall biosynthesis
MNPRRIFILTVNIGTGLAIDARILGGLLTKFGHLVEVHDIRDAPSAGFQPPDCSIFLERFDPRWAGRLNLLIPNPEWIRPEDVSLLGRFELIACKTREAMRVLGAHVVPERLIYIGWTSLDRRRVNVPREWDTFLHIAGCSNQKGTDVVLEAWKQNPDLPPLTVSDWRENRPRQPALPNVKFIPHRISEDALLTEMNRCGIHLCPSLTEGFGHTIHEAMSCGAVLVTTDGPAMNELTREWAVLVKPSGEGRLGLATTYPVDPSQLTAVVRKVLDMSHDRRRSLGEAARASWEQNRLEFMPAIEKLARIIDQRLDGSSGVIEAPRESGFGRNQFRA